MSNSEIRYEKGTAGAFLVENQQLRHDTVAAKVGGKVVDLQTAVAENVDVTPVQADDAGAFPMWLAPVQVSLLTVADRHVEFARSLENRLREHHIRVQVNDDSEKRGAKIRQTRLQRIPAMAVIGDKEVDEGGVSLKNRVDGDMGFISVDEFIRFLEEKAAPPEI
jgi:threonyl-tRNA synthetase